MAEGFTAELLALHSVAAACVDARGRVREASAGFRALLPAGQRDDPEANVSSAFIQPTFAELLVRPPDAAGRVYVGRLTLGDRTGETRTLVGWVQRETDGLRLLAERDIEELERLYASSIHLSHELAEKERELALMNRRVRELSLTDALTGIGNRRKFDDRLLAEHSVAERYGRPLTLLMCDIDHFKQVNDTFGHAAGDLVLQQFVHLLSAGARRSDLVARYGGEEFALLLPQTPKAGALEIAERLCRAVAEYGFAGITHSLTASFGVAEQVPGGSAEELLGRADAALYQAKAAGRNRVVVAADTPGA